MTQKINEIQKETIKDVQKKLKEHHKCLLVRPTGFGKTKIAVDIMRKYKHAVFLYPTNYIKKAVTKYNTSNVDLHLYSYNKLRNLYKSYEDFEKIFSKFNLRNTLFIMDEAHSIAAFETTKAIECLIRNICPNANFLGLTATPNRTDKLEIKWHYFDGITAYEYGLREAFNDGIFEKPHYIYTPLDGYNVKRTLESRINKLQVSKAKKEQLLSRVKSNINPQKMNIENLDEIIENNIDKFHNNMNYYKFILFFTKYKDIHNKQNEIVSAFDKVFPNCKINVIIVSSENHKYRSNLDRIDELYPRENTIDLILNVNMLVFGYHVEDITGIMMFRQTVSDIIYSQQVGRCLSVMQKHRTIIFDFVENLYNTPNNSVWDIENKSPDLNLNSIGIVLPMEHIELDEMTKELLEIDRLINGVIREEFEEEVVIAYKLGIIEIDYCIMKLQLHNDEDFMKILERYK